MKKTLSLLSFLIVFCSYGQHLECKDFKKGTFLLTSEDFPGVEWEIKRKKRTQKEVTVNIPSKYKKLGYPTAPTYAKIEWINQCRYKLIYVKKESKLDEFQNSINENGGIITNLKESEGRCFTYISRFKFKDLQMEGKGKICKK